MDRWKALEIACYGVGIWFCFHFYGIVFAHESISDKGYWVVISHLISLVILFSAGLAIRFSFKYKNRIHSNDLVKSLILLSVFFGWISFFNFYINLYTCNIHCYYSELAFSILFFALPQTIVALYYLLSIKFTYRKLILSFLVTIAVVDFLFIKLSFIIDTLLWFNKVLNWTWMLAFIAISLIPLIAVMAIYLRKQYLLKILIVLLPILVFVTFVIPVKFIDNIFAYIFYVAYILCPFALAFSFMLYTYKNFDRIITADETTKISLKVSQIPNICPYCHQRLPHELLKVCPFCFKVLPWADQIKDDTKIWGLDEEPSTAIKPDAQTTVKPTETAVKLNRCPNCGYEVQPEWHKCPMCGYNLKP